MFREKATQTADLPHQFEGAAVSDECRVCYTPALDPRHVAWERAAMARPPSSKLYRERGV